MQTLTRTPVDQLVADPFATRPRSPLAVFDGVEPLYISGGGVREKLAQLEAVIRAGVTIDSPPKHHFARGVYARELLIPKGMVIVGKIHKFSQINMVLRGDISVLTENGVHRAKAGEIVVSPGGVKRAGFAHEDTVWVTVHGTHETNLEKLEEELIAASFEEYDAFCAALLQGESRWLGQQ